MSTTVKFYDWTDSGRTYVLYSSVGDNMGFLNDEITQETNAPGSFVFTLTPEHPCFDYVKPMTGHIIADRDGKTLFDGRAVSVGADINNFKKFSCEGMLGVLYDSIQPRLKYSGATPTTILTGFLQYHNGHCYAWPYQSNTKKWTAVQLGTVTVTASEPLLRYTNRETTLEAIQDKLLDRLGGHLELRRGTANALYLDYLADWGDVVNQEIRLGSNILKYVHTTDYTPLATACIPLGAMQQTSEYAALDGYLTIAGGTSSFAPGSTTPGTEVDVIQDNTAVANYGFICKVVQFDDIDNTADLIAAGQQWLASGQYAETTLDLTAADLCNLGYDGMEPLELNKQVRVISEPHGMDAIFPITKRTYHLTAPETDTVTLGGTGRAETFTNAVKKMTASKLKTLD